MNDAELDARIRNHFAAAARRCPVPDFDETLRAAQVCTPAPRRRRWHVIAVAASLVAAVLYQLRPMPGADGDALLMAQLSVTTHWSAPSDGWMNPPQAVDYSGLPSFEGINEPRLDLQEVEKWF